MPAPMRDWKKLKVFEMADGLVMAVYLDAESWPRSQQFSLTQQIQRAVVSVASNIVEGCSRGSEREYYRFLEIAYASACEAQYQLSIVSRFGWSKNAPKLETQAQSLGKALNAMIRALPET
jgi:four helix bundle protein